MKIVFAGDFVPIQRAQSLIEKEQFDLLLGSIKPIVESADYAAVNLEAPIKDESCKKIKKVGPSLGTSGKALECLKYAGFDLLCMSNNHFKDYGDESIALSIKLADRFGFDYVGAGENLEQAERALIKDIGGKKVAFLNCCETEFSIATDNKPGCNPINVIRTSLKIKELKETTDYVIIVIHGGIEHYQLPTPRMVETYRFFIEQGADAIINHHQHCYSGYEFYNGKPIVYGLGNFCFDWGIRNQIWHEGYLVELDFTDNEINLSLIPYTQCKDKVGVFLMDESKKQNFNQTIRELNSVIADEKLLKRKYQEHLKSTNKEFRAIISPYSNRYTTALCRRGLLPVIIPKYIYRRILLNIVNQSHVERLIHYLNSKLED